MAVMVCVNTLALKSVAAIAFVIEVPDPDPPVSVVGMWLMRNYVTTVASVGGEAVAFTIKPVISTRLRISCSPPGKTPAPSAFPIPNCLARIYAAVFISWVLVTPAPPFGRFSYV